MMARPWRTGTPLAAQKTHKELVTPDIPCWSGSPDCLPTLTLLSSWQGHLRGCRAWDLHTPKDSEQCCPSQAVPHTRVWLRVDGCFRLHLLHPCLEREAHRGALEEDSWEQGGRKGSCTRDSSRVLGVLGSWQKRPKGPKWDSGHRGSAQGLLFVPQEGAQQPFLAGGILHHPELWEKRG